LGRPSGRPSFYGRGVDGEKTIAEAALDLLGIAVLAITADRDIVFSNSAARALFERDTGVANANGRLRLPPPADAALLGILRSPTKRGWFQLPRRAERPVVGRVTPAASLPEAAPGLPQCFLVFMDDLDRADPSLAVPAVRALYGLTEAEARVACLVGYGLAPLDAAGALGVSEATARTQLKQVFVKLGISRQSDLVTAVLRVHYIEPIS
jgi:DNA-binding CsgD family transcriptional regulator